jgi:hypothetical protein
LLGCSFDQRLLLGALLDATEATNFRHRTCSLRRLLP